MIRDFVFDMQKHDDRVIVLMPKVPIKQMLEKDGYPFKSKQHAKWVDMYQRNGQTQSIENYTASNKRDKDLYRTCPKNYFISLIKILNCVFLISVAKGLKKILQMNGIKITINFIQLLG